MARTRDPQPVQGSNEPDALIIDKSDFINKLQSRIDVGEELYNRSITNVTELKQNQTEYHSWDDYNNELLKSSFNNDRSEYKTKYQDVNNFLIFSGPGTPAEELKDLKKDISRKLEFLRNLLNKVDLLKSKIEPPKPVRHEGQAVLAADNTKIFLVHGHNREVLLDVEKTISKLGLSPIILNEQPNSGKTLIEKFEEHSEVGFAIVLLTDDDEGKSRKEIDLKLRARQNVILELGYFIGKLTRARVLPLYSENVELPSDIHGVVYEPLDKSGNWRFAIVRELAAAGYTVDANKLL